jgi:hypothetical protein
MEIQLNFERDEIYECGAALLSVLACPKASDNDKRAELSASLCGKAIWIKYLSAPDDMTPVPVKLPYVFRDAKRVDRDVKTVERRIGERMVAGRMAVPFFSHAGLGNAFLLPRGIERLSVNQMAEFVLDDAGQADAGNVEKRFWAPSRPVIHLAVAAALFAQNLKKAGGTPCLELFLLNRECIEAVVHQAEALERLIADDPKFPVKTEQLIRVRLA